MKIAERPVAFSIVVMLVMVCLADGGCRSSERAHTPPDAQQGVHDSLGPGTLISLLRRQATATDPVEIGHIISCEIGRLHLTVGEERARELVDSATRVFERETADSTRSRIDDAVAAHIYGGEPCDSFARAGLLGASTYPKPPIPQ